MDGLRNGTDENWRGVGREVFRLVKEVNPEQPAVRAPLRASTSGGAALDRCSRTGGGLVVIAHSLLRAASPRHLCDHAPNRILLATAGPPFVADPTYSCREYFHVHSIGRTGIDAFGAYVVQSARADPVNNRYEREHASFAAGAVEQYRDICESPMGPLLGVLIWGRPCERLYFLAGLSPSKRDRREAGNSFEVPSILTNGPPPPPHTEELGPPAVLEVTTIPSRKRFHAIGRPSEHPIIARPSNWRSRRTPKPSSRKCR